MFSDGLSTHFRCLVQVDVASSSWMWRGPSKDMITFARVVEDWVRTASQPTKSSRMCPYVTHDLLYIYLHFLVVQPSSISFSDIIPQCMES